MLFKTGQQESHDPGRDRFLSLICQNIDRKSPDFTSPKAKKKAAKTPETTGFSRLFNHMEQRTHLHIEDFTNIVHRMIFRITPDGISTLKSLDLPPQAVQAALSLNYMVKDFHQYDINDRLDIIASMPHQPQPRNRTGPSGGSTTPAATSEYTAPGIPRSPTHR